MTITVKSPFKKVYFNLEVIQLNFDPEQSNSNSFISHLTSIFSHHTVRSWRIIHPSGVELIGQSDENKSQQVIPVLGDCVHPVIWKGYVELKRHDLRRHWENLVRHLCLDRSRQPSHCAIWRFDEDHNFYKLIGVDRNIKLSEKSFPTSIYTFSLGNITNGNRFMIRFGTFWLKRPRITYNDEGKTEIAIEDTKIKHNNAKKKFVLKFTLKTTTSGAIGPGTSKYRLVYDYKSIKRVIICSSKDGQIFTVQRLYFQLLYPPRVFIKAPENKSGVLKRIRTTDCGDKLSSDVIGGSDVLRLVMNIEDDSIITTIYGWQKYHHFDICYGSLTECTSTSTKPKYPKSFPLTVNYALNCIYSIGYHGGVKVLNQIILKYVKANKEELIVEALYRLFDAYLVGKVYNAIEHLKSLLDQIESEQINGEEKCETKNETNYQSWTIITPTQTIFTPPITHDPTMNDPLIRVIVRDEDIDLSILLDKNMYDNLDEQIPYRKRSKANDQFLRDVIVKRFWNSGYFNVAGQAYIPKMDILIKSDQTTCYDQCNVQYKAAISFANASKAMLRKETKIRLVKQPRFLIPDTNCFIHHLSKLQTLVECGHFKVIVPLIVINELNGLMSRITQPTSDSPLPLSIRETCDTDDREKEMKVGQAAKEAFDYLETSFNEKSNKLKIITSNGSFKNDMNFKNKNSKVEKTNDDDLVLSSCLRFIKKRNSKQKNPEDTDVFRETVLLTDDRNLRVKALSHNVPVKSLPVFLQFANLQ
ncbi:uncharacterized protein LOC112539873 [Tetranychus urticae]|uniref:PIN domain-containing protein n=1 Tax=Tetranychus urticae TaxID=32264 RepID=T1JWL8_TETUR|nr:uncharacterized protein LOC112539873 [Tetranychus urticae]